MNVKRWHFVWILVVVLIASCATETPPPEPTQTSEPAADDQPAPEETQTLRVMTYGSFDISEDVVRAFESEHNAQVQFLDAGDTGQMLSQAILSKDNPQADVMYGLDNTFLSRALNEDIFVPYEAENLAHIPDRFELDPEHRVSPVDFGDVCLNYDKAALEEAGVEPPASLEDLTEPAYEGMTVMENPASSSPGLAFLLATIDTLGEDQYLNYWAELSENGLLVVDDWSTAYYGEFSGGSGSEGTYPIVVSYATSPAAEVYFSEGALETPPTGAVTAPGTCFRQIEFVGVLRNAENVELGKQFVEFALSETFQEAIPLHMFVFPTNENAELPQVFKDFAVKAEEPARLPAESIEENRRDWIDAWTEVVLQ
jgi:thiamine transport system substrate-binding protein